MEIVSKGLPWAEIGDFDLNDERKRLQGVSSVAKSLRKVSKHAKSATDRIKNAFDRATKNTGNLAEKIGLKRSNEDKLLNVFINAPMIGFHRPVWPGLGKPKGGAFTVSDRQGRSKPIVRGKYRPHQGASERARRVAR